MSPSLGPLSLQGVSTGQAPAGATGDCRGLRGEGLLALPGQRPVQTVLESRAWMRERGDSRPSPGRQQECWEAKRTRQRRRQVDWEPEGEGAESMG